MSHIDHATTRLRAAAAELDAAWKEFKTACPTSVLCPTENVTTHEATQSLMKRLEGAADSQSENERKRIAKGC
jgi:hypothetical protein